MKEKLSGMDKYIFLFREMIILTDSQKKKKKKVKKKKRDNSDYKLTHF